MVATFQNHIYKGILARTRIIVKSKRLSWRSIILLCLSFCDINCNDLFKCQKPNLFCNYLFTIAAKRLTFLSLKYATLFQKNNYIEKFTNNAANQHIKFIGTTPFSYQSICNTAFSSVDSLFSDLLYVASGSQENLLWQPRI